MSTSINLQYYAKSSDKSSWTKSSFQGLQGQKVGYFFNLNECDVIAHGSKLRKILSLNLGFKL
jgi:hypothetical protein